MTGSDAIASLAPIVCPPLIPPPITTAEYTRDQWSRPAFGLILGVRPNSPLTTISVCSSRPRWSGEIVDKSRQALVKRGKQLVLESLEVVVVCVPVVHASHVHLDDGHLRFDQAACQQHRLAKLVPTVSVAVLFGFARDIKRLAEFSVDQDVVSLLHPS